MRRLYFSLGKNKFWEYVLLALFLLFFYGPLMNMLLLSFAGDYTVDSGIASFSDRFGYYGFFYG